METINVTCRVPAKNVEFLDTMATNLERDRSYLINKAIDHYIASQRWQLEEIDRGLAEIDRGEFATDEEVAAAFREVGTACVAVAAPAAGPAAATGMSCSSSPKLNRTAWLSPDDGPAR